LCGVCVHFRSDRRRYRGGDALDVAALRAETRVAGVRVSGLVYDVATVIDTVVTP
jgi:hypothetical protein